MFRHILHHPQGSFVSTLKYTVGFKQFPTCFDAYYIILREVLLEHWRTSEASQSLYLQLYKIGAIQFLCHQ
jgi:hypothetical protein